MRRIAAVVLGTAALLGVIATPAQASGGGVADSALAVVGQTWGATMPASLTQSAADAALAASR
ncbi:hypothetical protein [Streptomyces chattanoogensis]|uniref:hypothetical protein n=1 Tax=Streptomyces chattanoogensis TaxID=66876 RepID=UPI00062CB94B